MSPKSIVIITPPPCIPRASCIQTHSSPLRIHGPPLCIHGHSLCVHGPPQCVPTYADAPYSPPLASHMPHTVCTLQHTPAIPAPPRHAPIHDNTPGAHMDPICMPPPPHGTYLTAPTCCPPTLMCHPHRPPTLYVPLLPTSLCRHRRRLCAAATAVSVPPPLPSPCHHRHPLCITTTTYALCAPQHTPAVCTAPTP